FPRLEKHGITGPPRIMKLEYVELRLRKHQLADLVKKAGRIPFTVFAKGVQEAGGYLAENLKGHIFKEDNILYPTALKTLDAAEWQAANAEFDKIGYCSFTPGR
ncbi:MAG: hemerythrin domain-containing protein, partial [Dehalococcoidales bacterium]|nr:hemerythrin domain-containing protein [Dehalococcoidales bacterium]